MTTARWLSRAAALIWVGVGAMLLVRGAGMLAERAAASVGVRVCAAAVGLALGALKGRYVLSRAARRNRRRIEALPRPRPWQLFSGRMLVLIVAMIGLGIALRALAGAELLPWTLVGALYVGIGAALITCAPAQVRPDPPALPTRLDAAPAAEPGA